MFSTREVAKKLGLQTRTLSRYVQAGKLPAPEMVKSGGMTLHLWTEEDIERARELLPTIANGRKTRYQRQQQSALSTQQSAKATSKAKPKSSSRKRKPSGSKP